MKRQIKTVESECRWRPDQLKAHRRRERTGRCEVAVEEMSFALRQEEECASHTISLSPHKSDKQRSKCEFVAATKAIYADFLEKLFHT